jgi:hypothetical protein
MKCALICGSSDCTADCFNNKADDVHRFGFLFVRACLVETVRERDRVKIGTPSSGIALPFVVWDISHLTSLTRLVGHTLLLAMEDMPPSNSHGQRKIGYKTKVLQTEVRSKKGRI